ncbi:S8 family serine peptidase [Rhodothermus sp. AH-315-K08]|nr:S8 family serine peptidase [Rhodothermus sp. AH-315-K08]
MRSFLPILFLAATFMAVAPSSAQRAEGTFLIKVTPEADRGLRVVSTKQGVNTGIASMDDLNTRHGAISMERVFADAGKFEARHREFGLHRWYRVTIRQKEILDTVLDEYLRNRSVEKAERVSVRRMIGTPASDNAPFRVQIPNDPSFATQWQYNSNSDADIDLAEAWDLTTGSPDVIVAVLDSGADLDHPDLAPNLWVNPGEIAGNGIDDDNNGFIDDVNGWDFSDGDNDPSDSDGHGSHTGGTVAAATNNGVGVSGVAGGFGGGGGARLMPLKIFEEAVDDIIANAFIYAADNGAVVASNSWGGGDTSSLIENAIDYFIANAGGPGKAMVGGIVVFAAGNDGTNSAANGYPASYAPVIAVSASDQSDQLPDWSNYGSWVDITAPGVSILSTVVNGYDSYDGTSMAAPHVAGVAALLASYAPGLTATEVRQILESSADNIDSQNPGRVGQLGSGRLNAFAALSLAVPPPPDLTDPGAISGLSLTGTSYASLDFTWTATGDDGNDGRAARYDIRFSTSPITDFDSAPAFSSPPTPSVAGTTENFTLTGLQSTTTYYMALRAMDEAGNEGPVSATASGTTEAGPSISVNPTSLAGSVAGGSATSFSLTISNTGTSSVTVNVSTSTVSTSSYKPTREIAPGARAAKERNRSVVLRGSPIVQLSGGSLLVWDADASLGGDAVRNELEALGYSVDYTTSLGSINDLTVYDAVFVSLGMFPNNHELTGGQGDALAAYLDAGGGLYMEGGDTWAYDSPQSVHSYFGLNGVDDGSNDLSTASGIADTWTAGENWAYTTDWDFADYVDRLEPAGDGFTVLENTAEGYGVAIAQDAGSFRSIGASFAAGLLSSSDLRLFLAGAAEFLTESAVGNWLAATPESGAIAPGGQLVLTISADASSLVAGDYEGAVTMASVDGVLRVQVPVAITVTGGGGGGGGGETLPSATIQLEANDIAAGDGARISSWADASGNGHNATQGGQRRPIVISSSAGRAVVFDGANDYLKLANDGDINTGGPYEAKTIGLVLETGQSTWERQVIFEEGGASRGISIYVFEDRLYLAAWNLPSDGGGGSWGPVVVSTDVAPDNSYQVILRLDGAAGTISGRVDGTSIGEESGAGTLFAHSGRVGLGAMWGASRFHDRKYSGTGLYWTGSISALRYYNEVLTDGQSTTLESEFEADYETSSTQSLTSLSDNEPVVPASFELGQNYPNPFNPTTTISFTIPTEAPVRIEVYDVLGRLVRTLLNTTQAAGSHTVTWDGRDVSGTPVSSGTYLYRITAGGLAQTRAMLLLK